MPIEDKSRGKAPNLKSRQAALEVLVITLTDIVLNMQLDPQEKSKLLASAAAVSRESGLRDTGWYDAPQT